MPFYGISKTIFYAAQRIEVIFEGIGSPWAGSGFFVQGQERIFVTNRHVLDPNFIKRKLENPKINCIVLDGFAVGDRMRLSFDRNRYDKAFRVYFPDDLNLDLALIKFTFGRPLLMQDNPSVMRSFENFIPLGSFVNTSDFSGINPGESVFFVGYPCINGQTLTEPFVRSGVLASAPDKNFHPTPRGADRQLKGPYGIYEGLSLAGSSGSPVLLTRPCVTSRYDDNGSILDHGSIVPPGYLEVQNQFRLLGLNCGHLEHSDVSHPMLSYFLKSWVIQEQLIKAGFETPDLSG